MATTVYHSLGASRRQAGVPQVVDVAPRYRACLLEVAMEITMRWQRRSARTAPPMGERSEPLATRRSGEAGHAAQVLVAALAGPCFIAHVGRMAGHACLDRALPHVLTWPAGGGGGCCLQTFSVLVRLRCVCVAFPAFPPTPSIGRASATQPPTCGAASCVVQSKTLHLCGA